MFQNLRDTVSLCLHVSYRAAKVSSQLVHYVLLRVRPLLGCLLCTPQKLHQRGVGRGSLRDGWLQGSHVRMVVGVPVLCAWRWRNGYARRRSVCLSQALAHLFYHRVS